LRALPGDLALGHVRYSTTGSSAWENAQPIYRSDERELALAHNGNLTNAVVDVLPRLHGAFSTVVMTREKIVAFRDPHGLRPLALGMIGDRYCVASESCALDIIGARFLRELEPGEVLTIDEGGIATRMAVEGARRAFCVFEYIYFARPDSIMSGTVLQGAR